MTQRSITALRIGNFKAFADTQRIPLKPITLIFGPNSAGKSSLIQSIAFAHEAEFGRDQSGPARLDVHRTSIGGNSIDLGGFRQFVHQRRANKRVEWGADLNVASLGKRLQELLEGIRQVSITLSVGIQLDDQERAQRGADPRIDSVLITADGEEMLHLSHRRSSPEGTTLRLDRLSSDHAVFRRIVGAIIESSTTAEGLQEDDAPLVDDALAGLLPDLDARTTRFLPETVKLRDGDEAAASKSHLLIPISRGNRGEDIARALRTYLPDILDEIVGGLSHCVAVQLGWLRYLGPVRERPTRHLAYPDQRDTNWEAGGAFAWDVLARNEGVRNRVNEWLGGHPGVSGMDAGLNAMANGVPVEAPWMKTPYKLFVDRYTANTELRDALVQAFYERPLTLLQRRELLTKDLAQVYASLQEQYETDQARAEEYAKQLEPWIERIQAARSPDEHDKLVEEAMAHFQRERDKELDSPEAQWEMLQEQQAEDAPHEEAVARAAEFLTALDKSDALAITELRLWDVHKRTAVSLCDVGFGISQVLPVLVLAYESEKRLIAIEQPEIHLHPALQAELADVFIESALAERQNTFVLETHSEHLILRLMRRMRETHEGKLPGGKLPITPADVSVLYVEPYGNRSVFREMPLNEAGQLVKAWPGGFFEEGLKEQFGDA